MPFCPNSGWLRGTCTAHGTRRWRSAPCKRRGCSFCGQKRKELIAERISYGIAELGGLEGGGWSVGTFDRDIPKWQAVRIANQFVQKLKRYFRKTYGLNVEWSKVWEVHPHSGRLHLNLLVSPWCYVPQKMLARWWHKLGGGVVFWIERVGAGVGVEAAKSRRNMGLYLGKLDQMVKTGRGVSYSKGWPRVPRDNPLARRGEVKWEWVGSFSAEGIIHWYETELGHWKEVSLDEWASADPEPCDCFEFNKTLGRARSIMRILRGPGPGRPELVRYHRRQ